MTDRNGGSADRRTGGSLLPFSPSVPSLPSEIGTVVIGGGVLGLCVAAFLAEEGHDVLLIDAGRTSGTATNAGSLHVQMQSRFMRMYPDQVPALESTLHLYPKAVAFWQELERRLNADFGMKMTGGLMVAESRAQLDFLARKAARERALGLNAEIIERSELNRIAPYLGPAVVGAELCANEGKLDPLATNIALRRWTSGLDLVMVEETPVERLERGQGRYKIHTRSAVVEAGTVVIAAAAGSRDLVRGFGLDLRVDAEPLHMNITEPAESFIGHLVQHADRPITIKQLISGHVVIGGGWPAQFTGPRHYPEVRLESLIGNVSLAQHIVPAIGPLNVIRTWAGVNTTTDGKGVLGPIDGFPGAFVAIPGDAGYTLGPLSARLVADAVLGRKPSEDLAPYSPNRF